MKVGNVKTANTLIESSPGGAPKRVPTRARWVYRFSVPVRGGERRLLIVFGAPRPMA